MENLTEEKTSIEDADLDFCVAATSLATTFNGGQLTYAGPTGNDNKKQSNACSSTDHPSIQRENRGLVMRSPGTVADERATECPFCTAVWLGSSTYSLHPPHLFR
jgi:hypothetical protein